MHRASHHLQQRPLTRTSRAAISARGKWSVQAIHPQPPPILRVNGQLPPQPPSTHLALGQLPSQPAPTEQPGTHHQPLSIQRERPAAIISRRKSGIHHLKSAHGQLPSQLSPRSEQAHSISRRQSNRKRPAAIISRHHQKKGLAIHSPPPKYLQS